ncbi:hypothetical protein HF086_003178 [Spodoptera exigua]|uniref:Serpin domain-containing protein n=1 Tax=Spodoptera exigua TaxID=7107 RepID=A0A922MF89_SPOEX|nr:hypothetical protein HF086_003178 [Spodoptera exigua]
MTQNMDNKSLLFLFVTTLYFQSSRQNAVDILISSTVIPTTYVENDNLGATNIEDNSIPNAINNFGFNLLVKMMKERENENIVISPIGVAGLLAMTLLGSVGMTHDEIAETLGFSQDFHMIALPYNDSETVMYALKPISHKQLTLLDLMEKINNKVIDETINEMDIKNCVIRFPKMKIKSTTKLEGTLQSIGLQSMFIPGKANFALMVNHTDQLTNKPKEQSDKHVENTNILDNLPNPGIHVDSIIHDVKLTINEFGTEAVAATSGTLTRSAETFYADSPFYIFIRNERTKLVTFSAVIFDPTK